MSKKEKTKEFLGNWYIINAAKNWIGLNLTFNMCDEVRNLYKSTPILDKSEEQHFEDTLFEYARIRKEENETG